MTAAVCALFPFAARFTVRLFGAAALDPEAYEDVRADRGATGQAASSSSLQRAAASAPPQAAGRSGTCCGSAACRARRVATWASSPLRSDRASMPGPDTRVDVGQLLRTIARIHAGLIRVLACSRSRSPCSRCRPLDSLPQRRGVRRRLTTRAPQAPGRVRARMGPGPSCLPSCLLVLRSSGVVSLGRTTLPERRSGRRFVERVEPLGRTSAPAITHLSQARRLR